jgi:predicted DsbA family dithiol-disulfide isomerase
MKVKVWSDVRCPFCYIGKRKFEKALANFEHKEDVEVEWMSFQLDPTLETQPEIEVSDYLANAKGMSPTQAVGMFSQVTAVAKEVGLDMNLKDSVLANSFKAHRLIQYTKYKGKGDAIEEELFKVHFVNVKNIDDDQVLLEAGAAIGLDPVELHEVLSSTAFSDEVQLDQLAAQQLGINAVPFFVFDDKYGVSGAQPPEVFLETLEKAWAYAG